MHRSIIALSLAAIVTSALPVFAGPNGGSPSFFPLQRHPQVATPERAPHALLGSATDEADSVRALPPGVTGKYPARTFQRRPSEGK